MSLYITGITLPPNAPGCEVILRIKADGTVCNAQNIHLDAKATEIPQHGRLGDLDALAEEYRAMGEAHTITHDLNRYKLGMGELIEHLKSVSTIIEEG